MGYGSDAWNGFKTYTGVGRGIDMLDPSKGYNTAAKAGASASQQWANLGNEQWNRQMTGLGGAMDQYGNARSSMGVYRDAMSRPGTGEQAWAQYGGQFMQPSNTQSMTDRLGGQYRDQNRGMQQMAGQFGEQLQGPSNSQSLWGQLQSPGETQSMQQYKYGSSAMERPGATEQFNSQMSGQLGRPSETAQAYATMDWGLAGAPSTNQFDNLQRLFASKGAATSAAEANQRAIALEQARMDDDQNRVMGQLGAKGGVQQYEGEVAGLSRGANALQGYAGRQGGQYEQQGDFEKFASDFAKAGTNAYYDRAEQQGLAKLNQEMARRGSFKSGGANAAIGNYLGETAAQRAKAIGDTLNQGQQAKFSRLGQGAELAKGVSGEKLGQAGALQSLGQAKSGEQIGRANVTQNAVNSRNQQSLALMGANLQAGQASSGEELARQQLLGSQARDASQGKLAAMQAQMNAAGQTDSTGLQRLMSQYGMAQGSDQALGNRMNYLQQGAGQADSSTAQQRQLQALLAGQSDNQLLQRLQGAFGMQQGANAQGMQGDQQMLAALMGQDQLRMSGLNGLLQAANTTQGMQQNRLGGVVDRDAALAGQQAGLYDSFYGRGGALYGDATGSGINAELLGAMQGAAGQQAKQAMFADFLKTLQGNAGAPLGMLTGGAGGKGAVPGMQGGR